MYRSHVTMSCKNSCQGFSTKHTYTSLTSVRFVKNGANLTHCELKLFEVLKGICDGTIDSLLQRRSPYMIEHVSEVAFMTWR